MPSRNDCAQGLSTPTQHREPAVCRRLIGDSDLGLFPDDGLHDAVAADDLNFERDTRLIFGERPQRLTQQIRQEAFSARHANVTAAQSGEIRQLHPKLLFGGEGFAYVLQQQLAGRRELYARFAPVDQRRAQRVFGPLDMAAEGRRRYVKQLGCFADRPGVRDLVEVPVFRWQKTARHARHYQPETAVHGRLRK